MKRNDIIIRQTDRQTEVSRLCNFIVDFKALTGVLQKAAQPAGAFLL